MDELEQFEQLMQVLDASREKLEATPEWQAYEAARKKVEATREYEVFEAAQKVIRMNVIVGKKR
jgi:hypothetical protein